MSAPTLPDALVGVTAPIPLGVRASERMDAGFVLGFDELPAGRIRELQRFLTAVIEQRGMPLHLNCLWNALYYGWDLTAAGYPMEALNLDALVEVQMDERSDALPVGAFALITTGAHELVGEVVAKYGEMPDLVVGDVAGELAGKPAGGPVLTERIVIDHAALPDWMDLEPRKLARLRRNARWVDERGHVVYDADYGSSGAADRSDVDFYLDWLLTHRRAGLLEWAFVGGTAGLDNDDIDAAAGATFATVRALLDATPGLVRFGDRWWTAEAYARQVADDSGTHRLGAQELSTLWSIVRSTYREALRWRAVALELNDLALHRWNEEDHEEVFTATAWVRSVFVANRYLADRVAQESHGGILNPSSQGAGPGDPPVHVRIDDVWQAGGLWRTEVAEEPRWYHTVAADIALGLGSGGEAAPEALAEDELPVLVPVADVVSEIERTWTTFLSADEHAHGYLQVPVEAARLLSDGPVTVRLSHDPRVGGVAASEVACHTVALSEDRITGIVWPGRLLVATELSCRLVRGSRVIDVESRLLDEPVDVDGVLVHHRHDRRLLQRVAGVTAAIQLRRNVAAILRTLVGADAVTRADGARVVGLVTLAAAVFGERARTDPALLGRVLGILDDLGVHRDGLAVVVAPGEALPGVRGQRTPTPLRPSQRASIGAAVRREPRMTLRRRAPGEPPPDQVSYAMAREAAGEQAVLPAELDSDWTYQPVGFARAGVDGDMLRRIGPTQHYDDDL